MRYHVLNRGNGQVKVFHNCGDYAAFVELMAEAHERLPLRPFRKRWKAEASPFLIPEGRKVECPLFFPRKRGRSIAASPLILQDHLLVTSDSGRSLLIRHVD